MYGFEDKRSQRIVNLLSDQIRREVLCGILEPQAQLSLAQLKSEFGGNSLDIQKALLQLSTEGLIQQQASGDFVVVKPKETDVIDLIEKRAEIECEILACAMEKGNIHWHGLLQSAQRNLLETLALAKNNFDVYASSLEESNKAFHHCLGIACDVEELKQKQAKLYQQSFRFRVAKMRDYSQNLNQLTSIVNSLVDAVLNRDLIQAKQLLHRFITFQPL